MSRSLLEVLTLHQGVRNGAFVESMPHDSSLFFISMDNLTHNAVNQSTAPFYCDLYDQGSIQDSCCTT